MLHTHSSVDFGFMDLWRPDWMLITIGLAIIFLTMMRPASTRKVVSFMAGLLLLYISKGSPLAFYGHHYSFSLHMVQQSIDYFMMAPLLLYGLPDQFFVSILRHRVRGAIIDFFTRPLLSVVLFNMLFSLYHVPLIFDQMSNSLFIHVVYHLILQLTAFAMWWPILVPSVKRKAMTHMLKIGYMFANGVLLTPACALIIFADHLLYESYQGTLPFINLLTPLEDQQLGGVLMKLIQEVVYGSVIGIVFYQWYRAENPAENDQPEGKW